MAIMKKGTTNHESIKIGNMAIIFTHAQDGSPAIEMTDGKETYEVTGDDFKNVSSHFASHSRKGVRIGGQKSEAAKPAVKSRAPRGSKKEKAVATPAAQ